MDFPGGRRGTQILGSGALSAPGAKPGPPVGSRTCLKRKRRVRGSCGVVGLGWRLRGGWKFCGVGGLGGFCGFVRVGVCGVGELGSWGWGKWRVAQGKAEPHLAIANRRRIPSRRRELSSLGLSNCARTCVPLTRNLLKIIVLPHRPCEPQLLIDPPNNQDTFLGVDHFFWRTAKSKEKMEATEQLQNQRKATGAMPIALAYPSLAPKASPHSPANRRGPHREGPARR